jgi:hypothetical protein
MVIYIDKYRCEVFERFSFEFIQSFDEEIFQIYSFVCIMKTVYVYIQWYRQSSTS